MALERNDERCQVARWVQIAQYERPAVITTTSSNSSAEKKSMVIKANEEAQYFTEKLN